jgi:hypothetical protein
VVTDLQPSSTAPFLTSMNNTTLHPPKKYYNTGNRITEIYLQRKE